jgi:DtxR family Mn-dependent transcriptional regulator
MAEPQEMVVLTLARAEENQRVLTPADLSKALEPGDALDLEALVAKSFASIRADRTIALTETGRELGRSLLRRHRLAERLFTDVVGLDWARAHEEADKFEHLVSPEAEQRLASQLGEPETCPHGNPIPRAGRAPVRETSHSLVDCAPKTRATITRIALETLPALQHLATLGLLPNVEIEIENRAPFDGPVLVRVGRAHYALGYDLAARVWVNPL